MLRHLWFRAVPLLAVVAVAGCSSIGTETTNALLPTGHVQVTAADAYPISTLIQTTAAVAVAYYIIDPLAPNWEIRETRLSKAEYRLSLTMKAYTSGGDGEARQVFQRRAGQLVRDGGYVGYHIVSYTEGLESTTFPAPHQVAEGVVRLVSTELH